MQDKLLSYGKSNSSWGLTIRDVLIDYCNEYGVAATSTYYVTNFDIFAEVGRNRPVIVFGYFPDSPGQVQSRGKVFHAVTAYGTSTSGLVTKLIVHYGWSGYSHVTLDGGLVGSSTQFECEEIITKVPVYAVERIEAMKRVGFKKSTKLLVGTMDGYAYKDYWTINRGVYIPLDDLEAKEKA